MYRIIRLTQFENFCYYKTMKEKKYTYESEELIVSYDVNRCIHARECVKGLKEVFDPKKRPWIQPENASTDRIAKIVEQCPTGALHYTFKNNERQEDIPVKNTISIVKNGPVYLRGDIEVQDADGNTVLTDTRFALCRCGQSSNKPACDNTHTKINFEASASFDQSSLAEENPTDDDSKLILKLMKNGPVLVQGSYQLYSDTSQPVQCSKNIALCRCSGSANKPFCDGTHKKIGFEG